MYDYDVVVIGGGPAGSTVATLLSQWGRRVLLLEKEHFPRHHRRSKSICL
jgi:FAD-dependent halogenase